MSYLRKQRLQLLFSIDLRFYRCWSSKAWWRKLNCQPPSVMKHVMQVTMCNISPSRGVITPLITRHETCLRCRLTPRILERSGAPGWTPGSWDINCLSLSHGALANLSSMARGKKSNVFTDRLQQLVEWRFEEKRWKLRAISVKFSHTGSQVIKLEKRKHSRWLSNLA